MKKGSPDDDDGSLSEADTILTGNWSNPDNAVSNNASRHGDGDKQERHEHQDEEQEEKLLRSSTKIPLEITIGGNVSSFDISSLGTSEKNKRQRQSSIVSIEQGNSGPLTDDIAQQPKGQEESDIENIQDPNDDARKPHSSSRRRHHHHRRRRRRSDHTTSTSRRNSINRKTSKSIDAASRRSGHGGGGGSSRKRRESTSRRSGDRRPMRMSKSEGNLNYMIDSAARTPTKSEHRPRLHRRRSRRGSTSNRRREKSSSRAPPTTTTTLTTPESASRDRRKRRSRSGNTLRASRRGSISRQAMATKFFEEETELLEKTLFLLQATDVLEVDERNNSSKELLARELIRKEKWIEVNKNNNDDDEVPLEEEEEEGEKPSYQRTSSSRSLGNIAAEVVNAAKSTTKSAMKRATRGLQRSASSKKKLLVGSDLIDLAPSLLPPSP